MFGNVLEILGSPVMTCHAVYRNYCLCYIPSIERAESSTGHETCILCVGDQVVFLPPGRNTCGYNYLYTIFVCV